MSDSEPVIILNQAAGYGVLVGVGGLFALGMIFITRFLTKYLHEDANSTENFMVANRSIGKWWMASATYSSWTWASEFLFVSTAVYNFGIQASMYYSAGLCIQMCTMNVIGIHSKKKVPTAHTSLEIVDLRYGKAAHLVYIFLCLVTNLISCSCMIIAAAGAISIIAGNLHIVASTMLIPFGVLIYTSVAGLKGTFVTDFVHSLVLLIVLCYINTSVLTSDAVGGLDKLYEGVIAVDGDRYIEGNYQGLFLTGKTQGGIIFGLILTIGNFGLTVMDSSFWQKAFSATPEATCPGYLTAAITIFSNAWPLGAIIGAAAQVLELDPRFPIYPRKLTTYEVGSGFVLPYTLKATVGNKAVGGLLLIIYLAVTSTVSAQLISVSSIVSFDIYKKYINPSAKNKQLIRVSHLGVVFFGLFSAGFTVMLHYVGVNMTWMGYFISMVICPGIIPLVFTIIWDRQTKLAVIASPLIGMVAGLVIWITTAKHYYDEITIDSLAGLLPCLYGALTAIFLPGILSVVISLTIKPYKYDWDDFKKAQLLVQDDSASSSDSETTESQSQTEKTDVKIHTNPQTDSESLQPVENQDALLERYRKIALVAFFVALLVTWVLWPLPLYRDYIWSKEYFKGYVVVGMIWLYATTIVIGFFPLWEGRRAIQIILKGLWRDVTGWGKKGKAEEAPVSN